MPSLEGLKAIAERSSLMLPPVYILSFCNHADTALTAESIAD